MSLCLPIVAVAVFILTIILVLCVYLKDHIKYGGDAGAQPGMVEFRDEDVLTLPDGDADIDNNQTIMGSPYYERDQTNLKVSSAYNKYGLNTKRETMNFLLDMMPREEFYF